MATFYTEDMQKMDELRLLRKMVAEQKISDMGPCPSLLRHLNELEVLTRKLHDSITNMQAIVEKKITKV